VVAENTKPPMLHKIALEGELWQLMERRWAERKFKNDDGVETLSQFVFHRKGKPIGDLRKFWNRGCFEAGLPCDIVYKRDHNGEVVL